MTCGFRLGETNKFICAKNETMTLEMKKELIGLVGVPSIPNMAEK